MARVKRMGRVMPPPFKRKSVSISLPEGKKRSWQQLKVHEIAIGDTIAEFGLVDDIGTTLGGQVLLVNLEGVERRLDPNKTLLVFH